MAAMSAAVRNGRMTQVRSIALQRGMSRAAIPTGGSTRGRTSTGLRGGLWVADGGLAVADGGLVDGTSGACGGQGVAANPFLYVFMKSPDQRVAGKLRVSAASHSWEGKD